MSVTDHHNLVFFFNPFYYCFFNLISLPEILGWTMRVVIKWFFAEISFMKLALIKGSDKSDGYNMGVFHQAPGLTGGRESG